MTTNSLFLPPRRADAWDTLPVLDTTAIVRDPADSTKRMRVDVGAVATATTRVLTMPDQDVNLTPNTGTFAGAATALTALAALTPAADRLPYFDGASSAALATFTSFARTLLDDADETTARATLGVTIGTHVQAYDATLAALAAFNSNGFLVQTGADTFVARTLIGGTGVTVTEGAGGASNPSIAIGQSVATTATPEFLRIGVGVPSLTQRAFQTGGTPALTPGEVYRYQIVAVNGTNRVKVITCVELTATA